MSPLHVASHHAPLDATPSRDRGGAVPVLGLQPGRGEARDPRHSAAAARRASVLSSPRCIVAGWCSLRGIPLFDARRHAVGRGSSPALCSASNSSASIQGLPTPRRRARCCSSIWRRSSSCSARASFLPADRFSAWQWLGLVPVLRRHGGGVRPADAGARSAPDARRPDDGRRRAVLGVDHADHQGEPLDARLAGKGDALSARGLRADCWRSPRWSSANASPHAVERWRSARSPIRPSGWSASPSRSGSR